MALTRTELSSWLKLVGGIKALFDALDRQLRSDAGMSHDDYQILSRLHRGRGKSIRMSDLADEVGFSPSRLSHAITRLEEKGWVGRIPGTSDLRVVGAFLTEAGKARVRQVSPEHLNRVKRLVFETLGPERAGDVAEAMNEIRRAATASE